MRRRTACLGMWMFHYTDDAGYKGISSELVWRFKALKPPGDNSVGAYFTTLAKDEKNICARLRIPRAKLAFVFEFTGDTGLEPLAGGRGQYIFWSATDYLVTEDRQVFKGSTEPL